VEVVQPKHIQKTVRVQSRVTTQTTQAHAICKDKRSDGVVQQFGQYQLLESYLEVCREDDPDDGNQPCMSNGLTKWTRWT
jgi:hypothetical protein